MLLGFLVSGKSVRMDADVLIQMWACLDKKHANKSLRFWVWIASQGAL
jgi:hypothetical protein